MINSYLQEQTHIQLKVETLFKNKVFFLLKKKEKRKKRERPKQKVEKNSAPIFEPTCQLIKSKDLSNLCKPQCDSQFLLWLANSD